MTGSFSRRTFNMGKLVCKGSFLMFCMQPKFDCMQNPLSENKANSNSPDMANCEITGKEANDIVCSLWRAGAELWI